MREEVRQSKTAIAQIVDIKDQSRSLKIYQKEIEDRVQEINRLETAVNLKRIEIDQQVMSLTMLIVQINNPANEGHMDEIFIGDNDGPQIQIGRENMAEICQLVRLLYTIEPTDQVNAELVAVVDRHTRDWPNIGNI